MYYIVLYYIILYCIILYYINILYCIWTITQHTTFQRTNTKGFWDDAGSLFSSEFDVRLDSICSSMICMKVKCQKEDMKTSQISEPDFEILPCLSLYPGGFLWIAWSRWSRMTFRWRSSENQVADWACLVPWFHFDHLSIQRTDATLILYTLYIYTFYTYYIHIIYILCTYYIQFIYIYVYIYITIYRYTHISSVPFHMVNYLWDLVSLLLWPLRTWISFEVKNLTFQMMWQESWSWRWTSPGQNSLWSLVCQAFFYLAVQSVQVPDTELGFSMFLGFSDPVENKDFEKHSCTRVSSPLNMVWLQWNRREFAQFCLQRSNRYYQHGMTGVASATRVLWLQSVAAVL